MKCFCEEIRAIENLAIALNGGTEKSSYKCVVCTKKDRKKLRDDIEFRLEVMEEILKNGSGTIEDYQRVSLDFKLTIEMRWT